MRKRFSSMATLAVALVVLALGSGPLFCQAQLVSSFENNLSSSVGATWEGPGIPSSEFVSTGATDGTSALAIHHPTGWNIQAILKGGLPLAQDAASHDFLLLDATTTDQGVAGDGWSPSWRQIFVVFNSNQGGWQQSQLDFPVAADDGGSLTSTLVLDLVSSGVKANAQAYVNSGGGNGTYWELFLPMQGGDQGTVVKAGDYGPADSLVNAADYITWRKSVGGTTLANETVSQGTVDEADYTEWRAHFGKDYSQITTIIDNVRFANAGSGSGGLSATGVPEPSSCALLLVAMLALGRTRRVCR
jgi:hypothetical protein